MSNQIIKAAAGLMTLGLSAERSALMFYNFAGIINAGQENWKAEIRADYQKTFSMPRKMKKRRRKELNLDWSIACYDPFQ